MSVTADKIIHSRHSFINKQEEKNKYSSFLKTKLTQALTRHAISVVQYVQTLPTLVFSFIRDNRAGVNCLCNTITYV